MTRVQFNNPFMLGFDNLERMMEQLAKAGSEGFPPYNIEQLTENRLRISLAVAGYDEKDLEVSVEDNQLVIRGHQSSEAEQHQYLYRGIAGRNFQRTFMLAHGMRVSGATMDKGLLHIDLEKPEPKTKVTKIQINAFKKKEIEFKTKEEDD